MTIHITADTLHRLVKQAIDSGEAVFHQGDYGDRRHLEERARNLHS